MKCFRVYLFLFVLLSSTPAARADYIAPGEVKVKTAAYQPRWTSFAEGTYHYQISWQGIKVAEAQVDVGNQEADSQSDAYHVTATAKTAELISIFYKLRHKSESMFDAATLRPRRYYSWQKENSTEKTREINFQSTGEISTKGVKNGQIEDAVTFHSDNLTLDPIAAAFVARSLPLMPGETLSFDVFNGKHRYLIAFNVGPREKIKINDREYEAYKVTPKVQKLTDSEGEKRLKWATIWVSADDDREVLKLESRVLIGSVSAKLVKFVPRYGQGPVRAANLRLPSKEEPGS